MKVDDLLVIGLLVLGLPNLKLSGEYVWQHNDDQKGRGWYAGASYTFAEAPWQPTLAYKYSEFSRGYDPLFYGTSGERGTWAQGEVVGEYLLCNKNQKISQLKLILHLHLHPTVSTTNSTSRISLMGSTIATSRKKQTCTWTGHPLRTG